MSSEREKQLKKLFKAYIDGAVDLSGVVILVNEEDERIELLTLNATNIQAFLLMLHGLQTLHDNAISTTKFNKTVH
jgi:hypothetical protein